MFGRIALALVTGASLLPMTTMAAAQEATTDEEIVVTAQKREERLRDVPQSVTAVTSDQLERLQADSFEDYVGRIPGMVATGSGQPDVSRLVLRGLNNEGIGAAVATYVDETPYGSSSGLANGAVLAFNLDPFDIARIEVLRGPQGTLYGANSMAGLIKFVTRDPSSDGFEFRTRSSIESTNDGENSWAVRAAVNVPLGDQAALRISGVKREEGGFIDSFTDTNANNVFNAGETINEDVNSSETTAARATFLLQATPNLSFRVSAHIQDIVSQDDDGVTYDVPGAGAAPFEVGSPTYGDLFIRSAPFPLVVDASYRVYNGAVNWDLGWANFVSSSSYTELALVQNIFNSGSGGLRLTNNNDQEKFTQEFRLSSPSNEDGLEWLFGLFYTDETALFRQDIASLAGLGALSLSIASDYVETAAFGTVTYHFSPQFDVSAGVRFAQNDQDMSQCGTGTGLLAVVFAGVLSCFPNDGDEDVLTYSLSPRWRPTDNTMLYARIATGFRPGGPNVQAPVASSAIPPTYESDTTVSYEVGVKTDFLDNKLRLDAALFHTEWDNIQVVVFQPFSNLNLNGNANADTAVSQGAEWALTLTPSQNFRVSWTGAITDAHLTATPTTPGNPLRMRDGDSLPFSPGFSTSLDLDYEWTTFNDSTAYVGAGVRYVGDQRSSWSSSGPANWRQMKLDPYSIFDLRAGIQLGNGIGLDLFARNLTDERGPARVNDPTGAATADADVLRPRTIGLTLTTQF